MPDILDRAHALGLRCVTYTNQLAEPEQEGGRRCWIPRDCVAHDGKAGIFWRMAEGGRYDTFAAALAWMAHYAAHRLAATVPA